MGKSRLLSEMEETMGSAVITKIADNIISPLGGTSEENLKAVLDGKSMLRDRGTTFGVHEPFCASLLDRVEIELQFDKELDLATNLTFFEKLCILSAKRAIKQCDISPADSDVIFILSTTKGNVDCLSGSLTDERSYLAESARKIAEYFGNTGPATVVSNACISGVCAQITAVRALLGGKYRYAVVTGCDLLSRFIVSGFQSFKALSPVPCKPYDKDRTGLNLGEAAGTIILKTDAQSDPDSWHYIACSNHNDANHISGPSRTGEGSFRVLNDILRHINPDEIGFVNAHGTSTAYNDEMESIALHRAGLDAVPVNGFKGYFGHTLGAAGIIETILSMKAIENGVIPATRGFETPGTSYTVNISNHTRPTDRQAFVKILSGFGGSNAGIAYRKGGMA